MSPQIRNGWLAFAVLLIPVVLVGASTTALSFAMPAISEALQPTGTELLWIVDVYPLVLAGLLIPMGSLGDRFGRKRILIIGALGFALISAVAEFAPNASWLIAARAATGLFGSMLLPATLALIGTIFISARARSMAIAIWSAVFSAAAAAGPIIGGVLLDHFPWTSILLVGVPFSVLFLAFAWLLPEARDPKAGRVDVVSAALAMIAMIALVYGIKTFATGGDAWLGTAALGIGVGLGTLFVRRQRVLTHPMLDLELFRKPAFGGGLIINIVTNVAEYGMIFMITLHLQIITGMPTTLAGIALLPAAGMIILATLAVPFVKSRIGGAKTIVFGLVIGSIGYGIVAIWGVTTSPWPWLIGLVVLGLGLGLAWTTSTELVVTSAPVEKSGAASAASETGFELGAVLGTAIIGGFATALYQRFLVLPQWLADADAAAARETLGAAAHIAREAGAKGAELQAAAATAFTSAEQITAIITGAALLATALVVTIAGRMLRKRGVAGAATVAGERESSATERQEPLPTDRIPVAAN